MRIFWPKIALLWVCISAAALGANVQYKFSQAGNFPGASLTVPLAVSGMYIVGYYESSSVVAGYMQLGRTFTEINPPGALTSYVGALNRHSVAVGGFCDFYCNPQKGEHGFILDHGAYTTVDFPGLPRGSSTTIDGINNLGQIVGGYCQSNPECPPGVTLPPTHGFLDDHGVFTTLDYPGADGGTGAAAINDAGTIVGTYDIGLTGPHSFLYQNGIYTNIDYPVSGYTMATAINNHGVVAGYYATVSGNEYGFEYQNGNFTTIGVPGATATGMTGLSDAGVIAGIWSNNVTEETFKGIPVHDASE